MFNHIIGTAPILVPRKRTSIAVEYAFGSNPFGWAAHRQYRKGGNVFEDIGNSVVSFVKDPISYTGDRLAEVDKTIIQPIYREVIQPVGHALEKVGQGIAKDPVTFLAQVAAVAAAPFTAGQSLWALPVIAAASTAAHGGSLEQVLTATAISAATAYVGANASGWIMSGLSEASAVGPSFAIAGTPISFTAAQTIAQVGAGLSVAAISATGAAIQGRDPLQAAIPALAGTAAGVAVNQLAATDIFKDIGAEINKIGSNVSPIIQKTLTGVASSVITGAIAGRDATGAIVGNLATGAMEGLYSAVDFVGNMFKDNTGNLTKYGSATQGLLTNVVASVAAGAASSGQMGNQFAAKLNTSVANTFGTYLTGAYDALATQVQDLYYGASSTAKTLNTAAQNQESIRTTFNNQVGEYQSKQSDLDKLYAQEDSLIKQYNAATTQSEVDRLKNEISGVQTNIKTTVADMNAMYTNLETTRNNFSQAQLATADAQQKYFDLAKELGTKADLLTSKTNEITNSLTKELVMQIDPNFNEKDYAKLNNLGGGIDVYTHFMSTGKDQGLPTNMAAAQQDLITSKSALADSLLAAQGWPIPSMVPASIRQNAMQMINMQYGDNLAALKNATPENIASAASAGIGKSLDSYAPKYDSQTAKDAMFKQSMDQALAPGWYKPADFKMPAGMQFASQQDIADLIAKGAPIATASDSNGFTVYLKQDPNYKPIQKYDAQTGDIVSTASIINTITTKDMSPADILNYVSKASSDTLSYIAKVDSGMTGVSYTDSSSFVQTLKAGADIIRAAANTENAPLIYQFMSKGLNAAASGLDGLAQVTSSATMLESMITGVNPNDQPTMQITKYLNNMANAVRSDDMKASIQSLNDALNTKGTNVVGAVLNNVVDNPTGMMNFIGTNIVAMLPGFAAGKWVAGGVTAAAELQGFTSAAVEKMASGAGIATSRLYEMGMEAASNGLQAFNDTRATLKQVHPTWTDSELDAEAMSSAKLVAGTAAVTTLFTQKIGLDKVTQNVFGADKAGASAFTSVMNKLIASPLSEATGEAFQSGIPQLMNELIQKSYDPTRTVDTAIGQIAGQTTLGFIAGAGTSFAMTTLQSVTTAPSTIASSNGAFEAALNSTTNLNSLGSVINQWLPQTTSGSTDLVANTRNLVVSNVIASNPVYAQNYSNAGAFIDAIKTTTGVWDATILADTAAKAADGKFASQVTTLSQAKQMLAAQGLVNITDQDALNAGLVGATKPNETQLATTYADQNMVGLEELQAAAKQENYNATQDELNKLVGRGVQADVIAQFVKDIDPKAVTTAEATQYFQNLGYTKATAADIAQFVKSAPETEVQKSVAAWVDPRQVTRQEAINFFAQQGYTPTEEEIAKYVVQGPNVVQNDIQKQLAAYVDPRYVSAAEVRQAYKDLGLNAPVSASDISRLTGQYDQATLAAKAKENLPIVSANATYALLAGDSIQAQKVKDSLLAQTDAYKKLGLNQTEATNAATASIAAQYGVSVDNLLGALGTTSGDLSLTLNKSVDQIVEKIEQYQAQGMSSDQALQAALDTVAQAQGTTKSDLLSQIGATESSLKTYVTQQVSSSEKQLADLIAKNESAGMARDQATQKAIDDMANNLGTTRTDLLNKIDITSQQFQNEISIAKTDLSKQITVVGNQFQTQLTDTKSQILSQMQAYEKAGMDRDTALSLAISGVAQDLGTTKTDLLGQMQTSEAALKTELTTQTANLANQVQNVAQLLGKPVSQVTANDITMVQNMIAGQTQTNLAYDVNQDQVVDAKDLALIQQQQQIQQGQNVTQSIDPVTGLPVYTDKTTGQVITGFTPAAGSQWAPTGIYAALEQQKAQQAQTAQAQAAQAKQAQQKNQFGQLMNMLFQAPDAAGQTVTVKTPDPSKIGYIYDWSSIFATPAQASMMPSPYGPMNTVAPQQQQAANQPMFKMASGFAQGGIVGGNDIDVGDGGNIEDIINLLKGNSG